MTIFWIKYKEAAVTIINFVAWFGVFSADGWKTKKLAVKLKTIAIEVEQILAGIRGIFLVSRLYMVKSRAVLITPTMLKSVTCHVIDG